VHAFIAVFLIMPLLPSTWLQAQATLAGSASIGGMVTDSASGPAAGAIVTLRSASGSDVQTTKADTSGAYHFRGISDGSYSVHARLSETCQATSPIVALHAGQTATIDLTLPPAFAGSGSSAAASVGTPQFYDEPTFTVAGVTDTTNLGGHGSDTVVRAKESLAKDAISLERTQASKPLEPVSATETEAALRDALRHSPNSVDANLQLGRALLTDNKASDALPYLRRAGELLSPDTTSARAASVHHALGEAEEKAGNPLAAVHEFQRSAELDPSESNYFDWGAELLLHHAPEPADEVFRNGSSRFPDSRRMRIAAGVAAYLRGTYDDAARQLCQASDMDPGDPAPYLFLGKIESVDSTRSDEVYRRLKRFAEQHPENAWANYYYALSLWKRRRAPGDAAAIGTIESLLQRAVQIDPKFDLAYLQLGILHADREDFPAAVAAYRKAAEANPGLEAAHYRLAQTYRRIGDAAHAKQELEVYERLSKEASAQLQREHREVQQFVYTLKDGGQTPR
jgi:tetratricopeptide (TPR) repeat protein